MYIVGRRADLFIRRILPTANEAAGWWKFLSKNVAIFFFDIFFFLRNLT